MQNVDTHDMALCQKMLTNQGLSTKTSCRLLVKPLTHSESRFCNLCVHIEHISTNLENLKQIICIFKVFIMTQGKKFHKS
jgi:hypothetical protein